VYIYMYMHVYVYICVYIRAGPTSYSVGGMFKHIGCNRSVVFDFFWGRGAIRGIVVWMFEFEHGSRL
jgi:hypothetical protein